MERLKLLASTALGLGLVPVAPGTFGTLAGVAIAWGLSFTGAGFPLWVGVAAVLLYVVGRPLARWAERRAGNGDPGWFVLDEVVGYLVCIAWTTPPSPIALLAAFVLFRAFDIFKPPPVRRLEAVGGGDGVLLDDVMAGVYGLACMAVLRATLLEPSQWTVVGGA
ncbi:MAG: phosphatidylglycerophosphatase A [Planctomycetota bacterium]